MSADHDQRGTLAVRQGPPYRWQRGVPRHTVRKPIEKRYGATATYRQTAYERVRIARREARP